ncbi:MAG: sigma-54-dependent Fis family transcriptional regulator [Proteobacteria bacterium]|nr:sigma-54-dependent Fis family transcriptional regulator [Pseudomonadota bacterium]
MSQRKLLEGVSLMIVDHDSTILRELKRSFSQYGARIHLANTVSSAEEILKGELVQVVLADLGFRQSQLMNLFIQYKKLYEEGLFFIMTDHPVLESSEGSVLGMVNGLLDKPVDVSALSKELVNHIPQRTTSVSRLDPLTELLRPYLVFQSPAMRQNLMMLPKLAASNHSVLITGETGTGKEMVAHAIHGLSSVANGPFIAVNCGAIPESLIEGELFGHVKGAFTGAQANRKGKFELAQNGTIFLDELGEMPLALQARLLRVLEEKALYPVGGEKPIPINARVVTATQVALEKSVESGLFREDLYYRLNVLRIHLPALRERPEDVPLLSWHFLERAFAEMVRSKPYPTLARETIEILQQQYWKGNVRELRNTITRLAVLTPNNSSSITPDFLAAYFPEKLVFQQKNIPKEPQFERVTKPEYVGSEIVEHHVDPTVIEMPSYPEEEGVFIPAGTTMKEAEEKIISMTLDHTKGNRTKTAKVLGLGLRTIRRRLNDPQMDD